VVVSATLSWQAIHGGWLSALVLLLNAACQSPAASVAPTPPLAPTALTPALKWSFDGHSVGGLPAGTQVFSGTWAVRAEPGAPSPPNALCQTGNADFPALLLDAAPRTDVVLVTRFKPISGSVDQAAGLIARVKDGGNYYILRANALENNVNLYKYLDNRRSTLRDGPTRVATGQWQELRLEVRGDTLRGFISGQPVVQTSDGTFSAGGGVGLWTKADSQTCFDDVELSTPAS
jgi:hypothetical protein